MAGGWVKLHRQLLEHPMWVSHEAVAMWAYCLLKAAHNPTQAVIGCVVRDLKPGQFVFGRVKAQEDTTWSEWTIRKGIDLLVALGCITKVLDATRRCSIITVVNWERYQADTSKERHAGPARSEPNDPSVAPGAQGNSLFATRPPHPGSADNSTPYGPDIPKERSENPTTAPPLPHDSPTTPPHTRSKEQQEDKTTPAEISVPFKEIADAWNITTEAWPRLSPVLRMTKPRKVHLGARWKEPLFRERYGQIFMRVVKSPFLRGETSERGWACSFGWLIEREENYIKVLEGQYKAKDEGHGTTGQFDHGIDVGDATGRPAGEVLPVGDDGVSPGVAGDATF